MVERVDRVAWLTVTALMAALFAIGLVTVVPKWHLADLQAYLAAADLLASGGNPFDVQLWQQGLPYHYHYSPWFAALLVPLTAIPQPVVTIGWSVVLATAAVASLVPLVRGYGWWATPVVLFMGFLYLNVVAEGNVQPLLLAGLVWSLERRAGPVMIGVAASLKLVPILLALVYVGRGEWRRAAVAGIVTAILLSPTLLFEISPTALETGGTGLFTSAPIAWAVLLLAAVSVTVRLAGSRFAWLAASTATVLALPRLLVFDMTNLVVSFPHRRGAPRS